MTGEFDPEQVLADFSGQVPLFPLPNAVLFPQAILPLHIFEPRYRQMTADALAGEQLIAMALLRPVIEGAETPRPRPIWPTVGLGRIVAHQQLADGRYYLVLRGLARARVLAEVPSDKLYRIGQLELCPDDEPDFTAAAGLAQRLLDRFSDLFPGVKEHQVWTQVTERPLPLGVVCDLLTSALPLKPEGAQLFLEETNVLRRCDKLWDVLQQTEQRVKGSGPRAFPPGFSVN
jgi:Lon protease-like protein